MRKGKLGSKLDKVACYFLNVDFQLKYILCCFPQISSYLHSSSKYTESPVTIYLLQYFSLDTFVYFSLLILFPLMLCPFTVIRVGLLRNPKQQNVSTQHQSPILWREPSGYFSPADLVGSVH